MALAEDQERQAELQQARRARVDARALNVPFVGNRVSEAANNEELDLGTQDEMEEADTSLRQQVIQGRLLEKVRAERTSRGKGENPALNDLLATKPGFTARTKIGISGFVKILWLFLWPTAGHMIYFIDLTFFIGWIVRDAMRWDIFPKVGEEWIPPLIGAQPAQESARQIIRYPELAAMVVITGVVFLFDLLLFIIVIAIIGVLQGIF